MDAASFSPSKSGVGLCSTLTSCVNALHPAVSGSKTMLVYPFLHRGQGSLTLLLLTTGEKHAQGALPHCAPHWMICVAITHAQKQTSPFPLRGLASQLRFRFQSMNFHLNIAEHKVMANHSTMLEGLSRGARTKEEVIGLCLGLNGK